MNTVYPAIDMFKGRVVRLKRGDYGEETVYSSDPSAQAEIFEAKGASWLHIVDLEGAKNGRLANLDSLRSIRKKVRCNIQFGGGLRTLEDCELILSEGINRIVLGTKALDPEFFDQVMVRFPGKVAVGLDVMDGTVRTEGWLKSSGQHIEDVMKRLSQFPLETVIYTDISKDGMLKGPNMEGLRHVLNWAGMRVILSGGISSIEDVLACAQIKAVNFEGVIIGKALYEKRFDLREVFQLLRGEGG